MDDEEYEEVEMGRDEVLAMAANLVNGDREETYGDAVHLHRRIGLMWTAITQHHKPITPLEVALCMAAVKLCRATESPDHMDNFIDLAGYAALAWEMPSDLFVELHTNENPPTEENENA